MQVRDWEKFLVVCLGMLFQFGLTNNLYSQGRDTPMVAQFFERISGKSDVGGSSAPEYWVEYKPCLGGSRCYVQVTAPNEQVVERIKRRDRENSPNSHFYQWKVVDGISLDEVGEVDGRVQNTLPDSE